MLNVLEKEETKNKAMPTWFQNTLNAGYVPYLATSEQLFPFFNTSPFGHPIKCIPMEDPEHKDFHEAYLLSNSLSFETPDLKMPNWVLVDCVLLQTAVVGFMQPISVLPKSILSHYKNDTSIDCRRLAHIPVSGQIDSPAADGKGLINISLFSLRSKINGINHLGIYTKALALEVSRAADYDRYCVITQYDNPSLKIHGRFSSHVEITQPIVPLHPLKDMTLILQMKVNHNPHNLDTTGSEVKPSFWLNARDIFQKKRMQEGIKEGKSYVLTPPYTVSRNKEVYLPVIEKSPKGTTIG